MQSQDSWNDDDEEEDNVVAPLVVGEIENESTLRMRQRRQTKSRQRLASLELMLRQQEEAEPSQTTCLGDSWRLVASIILATIIVGPLVLKHYRHSSSTFWQASDSLSCAHDSKISYWNLYNTISSSKTTNYCRDTCTTCASPLVPKAAVDDSQLPLWNDAFQRNLALVKNTTTAPDVVLLGDSITEHWQGTSMGRNKYPEIHQVYQDLFQNKQETGIEGLALGISGDRVSTILHAQCTLVPLLLLLTHFPSSLYITNKCPQVLYRLQHGEQDIQPQVWWLLVGTNDLVSGGCSVEAVLIGILNLLHEIRSRDSNAVLVVNSILPRELLGESSGELLQDDNVFLWKNVSWVNERLACFVQGQERMEFFNATSIFLNKNLDHSINQTLMPDRLHPSAEGSRVWGSEIAKRVKELTTH